MRREPRERTAALIVELDGDTGPSTLRETVEGAGGEIVEALEFDCWLVELPEAGVDELCSLPAVVRVETDATLERGVDETVDPGAGEESGDTDREV